MKLSAEFLQSLPALPSDDFNKVDQSGFYHVKGLYFNSPVGDEIDGCLINVKYRGKPDIQQLFLTEGECSYERAGQSNWERNVIAPPQRCDAIMKREVWSGGYYATGECAPPSLMGEVEAISFDAAVVQSFRDSEVQPIKHPDGRWTHWGVPLFDNEVDAKAYFAQFG